MKNLSQTDVNRIAITDGHLSDEMKLYKAGGTGAKWRGRKGGGGGAGAEGRGQGRRDGGTGAEGRVRRDGCGGAWRGRINLKTNVSKLAMTNVHFADGMEPSKN